MDLQGLRRSAHAIRILQTDKLIAAEGRFIKADLYLRLEIPAPAAEAILRKTSSVKTVFKSAIAMSSVMKAS